MIKTVVYRQTNPYVKTNEYGMVSAYEFAVYRSTFDYCVPSLMILDECHSGTFEIQAYGLIVSEDNNRNAPSNEIDTGPMATKLYLLNHLVRTLCRTELQGLPHIRWIIDEERTTWFRRYGNGFRIAAEQKLKNQIRKTRWSEINLEAMTNRERRLFLNNPFRPQ